MLVIAAVATLGGGCSASGPTGEEAAAVRRAAVVFFNALIGGDVSALGSSISTACPAGVADELVAEYREVSADKSAVASVSEVDVMSIDDDVAVVRVTMNVTIAALGSGSGEPGEFQLHREDGRWVVSC